MKILLASGSPRRYELLSTLGLDVVVEVPSVTEISFLPGSTLVDVAEHNAKIKAHAVHKKAEPGSYDVIIAADTVVICHQKLLGKPADRNDAYTMLTTLSGQTHDVVTSYCLIRGNHVVVNSVVSQVTFRDLSKSEIEAYLSTNEWTDKAGAYAVQGLGAALVRHVVGSLTNVIGLPVEEVIRDARAIINR